MIRKIEPGDTIGRCRIIRELGRGGVGTVYLASHQTLQIEVALKILSPALSLDNPALAERFIREAQLAARIRHPNVIAVMDAAHDDATGLYFIVQEYVGGGSLSWHLRNGPLPERRSLEIITGIAQALIIAEELGIVHRDIKPDNVMLDTRGVAKLADLGLAKHSLESHISLTLGGSFMGTPAYMSPEQARDAKVADTRDDIYSLGATFYECLTGQPPFTGETPYNIMSELLTKPSPHPRAARPELSRSVDLVCRKMMAKTRALRYADARVLVQDLHHCGVVSDAGLDGLEAASFENETAQARQEALDLGVQPQLTGGGSIPPRKPAAPISNDASSHRPRPVDYGAFRAAALLILLVVGATLLFAWITPGHLWNDVMRRVSFFQSQKVSPAKPVAAPVIAPPKPIAVVPTPTTNPVSIVSTPAPEMTNTALATTTTNVAGPASTNLLTPIPGSVPALPADTNVAPVALPAVAAVPDSALEARKVAEKKLPNLVEADGQVPLLRVRGRRNERQLTPTIWTFEFFDPRAAGHARIVSVSDQRVVDTGERVTFIMSPYTRANVLPDDLIDSPQALQIAQQLVPDVTISDSAFVLSQEKNSAPFWTITLWAKNPQGEDIELGDVVLLAEKGDVISNTLKPQKLKD